MISGKQKEERKSDCRSTHRTSSLRSGELVAILAGPVPAGTTHSANLKVNNLFPVSVVVAKYVSLSS
jgi:hypothetical protein